MTTAVLLLNADYTPIKVIPWEKAIWLIMDQKARMVEDYANRKIRSTHSSFAWPAVVALVRYAKTGGKVRFNRANLLARDGYTCQYCGHAPRTSAGNPKLADLTIDHIVPRAQSVRGTVMLPWNKSRVAITCWENAVAACFPCNSRKADRTPGEAGLKLRHYPRKPTPWDAVVMSLTRMHIPEEWRLYIPENSGWRDYWTTELDPG